MGDPKKPKKKFDTPAHPWQKVRIEEEKTLEKEYGLKNKKEIWKMNSILRGFKNQAKIYASNDDAQSMKQKEEFMQKLVKLGILEPSANIDDVLGLELKDIIERRLQTQVVKRKLAGTMNQARQFIVHSHIAIGDKKINVPSYLVKKEEEGRICFAQTSGFIREDHPEISNVRNKK